MTTLKEKTPLIIGRRSDEKFVINILRSSKIENIAIVDISCLPLNNHSLLKIEIEKLKDDSDRLKIFHGLKWEHIFDNIIGSFHLIERKDFVYMGILKEKEVAKAFLNYNFQPFPETMSMWEGTYGEQI